MVELTNRGRTAWLPRGEFKPVMGLPLIEDPARQSWEVHIDGSAGNFGALRIGVCDEEGEHAWGFRAVTGKVDYFDANSSDIGQVGKSVMDGGAAIG